LFGEEYEEADALSLAPPRDGGEGVDVEVERMEKMRVHVDPVEEAGERIEEVKEWVRQQYPDAGFAIWGGVDASSEKVSNPPVGFKPTRKVRQGKR
jgi:hypothetical protein